MIQYNTTAYIIYYCMDRYRTTDILSPGLNQFALPACVVSNLMEIHIMGDTIHHAPTG